MSIDYTKPQIIVEHDPKGYHRVTFFGATANFARINQPEIVTDSNGTPKLDATGAPQMQWGVTLTYSPDVPGLKSLEDTCFGMLREAFGGEGRSPIKYGDDEYAEARRKNRAITDEDAESRWGWKRGKIIIKATTKKRPFIHNSVNSTDIVVCKAVLCVYPRKGKDADKTMNKGVSAFLDEIGTVKRGQGVGNGGGGAPRATLDVSQFAEDATPANASTPPSSSAPDNSGEMPWED